MYAYIFINCFILRFTWCNVAVTEEKLVLQNEIKALPNSR